MPFQVINEPGFAQNFGTGLTQAVGTGLQSLAQLKAQQLHQRHQSLSKQQQTAGLAALGFSPQEAQALSYLPDDIVKNVVTNKLQEPSQRAFAEGLSQLLGQSPAQVQQENKTGIELGEDGQVVAPQRNIFEYAEKETPQAMAASQQIQNKTSTQQPLSRLTEKQATTLAKLSLQQQKQQADATKLEQKEARADAKNFVSKITNEHDFAQFSQPRLNAMKKLVEKGGLPISSFYKILKNIEEHVTPVVGAAAGGTVGAALGGLGGPAGSAAGAATLGSLGAGLGALIQPIATLARHVQKNTSPNTEAFEKLTAGFLRGAKDVFGGRFTNEEMKAYLEGIPTLMQTDKGKLDVIHDMELFNKAANVKYRAVKEVLRENGGKYPLDFEEQVNTRAKKELDLLSDIFREDL